MIRRLVSALGRLRRRSSPPEPVTEEWVALTQRAMADMEARRIQLAPMAPVVADVSAILFAVDPIGLAGEGQEDEYDSEAETIVLRLAGEQRLLRDADVLDIVHEEFIRWFGADLAGPRERYEQAAARVSATWRDFLASAR